MRGLIPPPETEPETTELTADGDNEAEHSVASRRSDQSDPVRQALLILLATVGVLLFVRFELMPNSQASSAPSLDAPIQLPTPTTHAPPPSDHAWLYKAVEFTWESAEQLSHTLNEWHMAGWELVSSPTMIMNGAASNLMTWKRPASDDDMDAALVLQRTNAALRRSAAEFDAKHEHKLKPALQVSDMDSTHI